MSTVILKMAGYWDLFQTHIPVPSGVAGTQQTVLYDNLTLDIWQGVINGAAKFNQALLAVPADRQVIGVGISYGAVCMERWQMLYGNTSTVGPDRLSFIYEGNSVRTRNGHALSTYGPSLDNPRHHRTDIAAEGDVWADYPNVASSPVYNAAVNAVNVWDSNPGVHVNGYDKLVWNDPAWRKAEVGNTTYVLVPNPALVVPPYWGTTYTRAQLQGAYNRVGGLVPV